MIVGWFVLGLAYIGTGSGPAAKGYDLTARFSRADGISTGADVRLAGVSVGKVSEQRLDDHFHAVLTFRVAPGVQIPQDSAALIETDGLLGAKYIGIQPGADDANLKPGEEFHYTQDSVVVEDLLELIIGQARAAHPGAKLPDSSGGQ